MRIQFFDIGNETILISNSDRVQYCLNCVKEVICVVIHHLYTSSHNVVFFELEESNIFFYKNSKNTNQHRWIILDLFSGHLECENNANSKTTHNPKLKMCQLNI